MKKCKQAALSDSGYNSTSLGSEKTKEMFHISNNSELNKVNFDSQALPAKTQGVLDAQDKRGVAYPNSRRNWSARKDAMGMQTKAVMITLQLEQSTNSDKA